MSTGDKGQVIPKRAKKECEGVVVQLHSFLTSHYTQVSSQLHAAATLTLRRTPVPTEKRQDGPETQTRCYKEKKHLLLQLGSKSQLRSHPAHSLDIKHPCRGPIKFVLATFICKFAQCGISAVSNTYSTQLTSVKQNPFQASQSAELSKDRHVLASLAPSSVASSSLGMLDA